MVWRASGRPSLSQRDNSAACQAASVLHDMCTRPTVASSRQSSCNVRRLAGAFKWIARGAASVSIPRMLPALRKDRHGSGVKRRIRVYARSAEWHAGLGNSLLKNNSKCTNNTKRQCGRGVVRRLRRRTTRASEQAVGESLVQRPWEISGVRAMDFSACSAVDVRLVRWRYFGR
jgi:hypothetical protein